MLGFRPSPPSTRRARWPRRSLLVAAATLAALATTAPASQSATTRLTYTCNYPIIGNQPLTLDIPFSPIGTVPVATLMPRVPIPGVATDGGDFGLLMDVVAATQLSGTSKFTVPTALPQSSTIPIVVKLTTLKKTFAEGQPRTFSEYGLFPAIKSSKTGTITYAATTLAMNLTIRNAQGEAIELSASQSGEVPPSDDDPATFDVPCKLAPADQPATLGTTVVQPQGPDTTPPTKPGTPVASEITETSTRLTWAPSTDAFGVTGYDIYRDGTKLATTTATTFVATGLPPASTSTFTVIAHDAAGNPSAASDAATVTTLIPTNTVQLTFKCAVPLIATDAFTLKVETQIPPVVRAGVPTGRVAVKSTIIGGSDFGSLLAVTMVRSISGVGVTTFRLTASGLNVPLKVAFNVAPVAVASNNTGPVTLVGNGTLPSLTFRQPGPGTFSVTGMSLNLLGTDASGGPVGLGALSEIPDTDGDQNTFDVACTLDPATQATGLATFQVS